MKGHSLIQLFDSETGEEVERYENTNIVTNLFKKIVEDYLGTQPAWSGLSASAILAFDNLTPANFCDGLMMFDDVLPLDPNVVVIPKNLNCVGHAGTPYSGTDSYRGTYNSQESLINYQNSTKRVWDFASNQANGTIKSLALCHKAGGNLGTKCDTAMAITEPNVNVSNMEDTKLLFNNCTDTNIISFNGITTQYIGRINNSLSFYFLTSFNAPTVNIRKYIAPNYGSIGMNSNLSINTNSYVDKAMTIDSGTRIWLQIIDDVLYGLVVNTSTWVAYLKTYNIDTLVELTSVTLEVSGTTRQFYNNGWLQNFAIIDSKLYIIRNTANSFYVFDINTGSYLNEYTPVVIPAIGNGAIIHLYNYNKDYLGFIATPNENGVVKQYRFDGINPIKGPYYQGNPNYAQHTTQLKYGSPLVVVHYFDGASTYLSLGVDRTAMFTQNNLAIPIEKTAANTMKITYTLSW